VKKQYRPWTPEQAFLLPPSPMEWLPQGHLAYFILEVVAELSLSGLEEKIQRKDWRGTRPYSPRMMTALLLYGYAVGVFSSRKIERSTYEDVAFRVLSGGEHPHFTTINEFRREHGPELSALFVQVLQLCRRAGLRTVGHVSLDGTKVGANASKHKAMSYGRMKDEEKRLLGEVEQLLASADQVDAEEDAWYGRGQRPEDLPEELRRRDTRLAKIHEAKLALEKEASEARAAELLEHAKKQRQQAETSTDPVERKRAATRASKSEQKAAELTGRDDDHDDDAGASPTTELPKHRVPSTDDGEPTSKAQRNFTDPDSRIMVRNGVFMQAYNAQAVVSESQIIVAHAVTNQPPDQHNLIPMMERVRDNCGRLPDVLSADAGFICEDNIRYCERNELDAYIAVGRKDDDVRAGRLPMSPARQARWDMREKLKSALGRELYARRKTIVEPVFGQIKCAMPFARFSLRGLAKVGSEWGIVCCCHNLLKLFRSVGSLADLPASG
jgi:transposase